MCIMNQMIGLICLIGIICIVYLQFKSSSNIQYYQTHHHDHPSLESKIATSSSPRKTTTINEYHPGDLSCDTGIKEILDVKYRSGGFSTEFSNQLARKVINKQCKYKYSCRIYPSYDGIVFLDIDGIKHYISDPKEGKSKQLFIEWSCLSSGSQKSTQPSRATTTKYINIQEGTGIEKSTATMYCPAGINDITEARYVCPKDQRSLIITDRLTSCRNKASCSVTAIKNFLYVKEQERQNIVAPAPGCHRQLEIWYECNIVWPSNALTSSKHINIQEQTSIFSSACRIHCPHQIKDIIGARYLCAENQNSVIITDKLTQCRNKISCSVSPMHARRNNLAFMAEGIQRLPDQNNVNPAPNCNQQLQLEIWYDCK